VLSVYYVRRAVINHPVAPQLVCYVHQDSNKITLVKLAVLIVLLVLIRAQRGPLLVLYVKQVNPNRLLVNTLVIIAIMASSNNILGLKRVMNVCLVLTQVQPLLCSPVLNVHLDHIKL